MENAAIKFQVTWCVFSVFSGSLKSSRIIMVCSGLSGSRTNPQRSSSPNDVQPRVCSTLLYIPDLQFTALLTFL